MQSIDVPKLQAPDELKRDLLLETFGEEILSCWLEKDPSRFGLFGDIIDFIMSTAYSLTTPDGRDEAGNLNGFVIGSGLLPVRDSELELLLKGMVLFDLVTVEVLDLSDGAREAGAKPMQENTPWKGKVVRVRITKSAFEQIPAPPKSLQDG